VEDVLGKAGEEKKVKAVISLARLEKDPAYMDEGPVLKD
jgi:hypothetical protein